MRVVSVGDILAYLKLILESDPNLGDLWVLGEVTNLSQPPSGHLYFGLKDEQGQLKCVMFRREAARLQIPLQAGQSVIVHGRLNLYPAQGSLQLYADLVQPEGVGLAFLQFEALKLKLEREGLFAEERKRPLPPFPRRIGLVTSEGGAVLHDIISVLGRRYPLAELVLAPSSVQGEGAPREIVAALQRLAEYHESVAPLDLILVARGGGSAEDLAAFNDEQVARAVFAAPVPVVSAIGHETDTTLIDYVADLRAPTPSAAAELIAPDLSEYARRVHELRRAGAEAIAALLAERKGALGDMERRLGAASPATVIARSRERVVAARARARAAVARLIAARSAVLEGRRLQLSALSPVGTLERGYCLCYDERATRVLTSASMVGAGEVVRIQFRDGALRSRVLPDGAARDGVAVGEELSGG